MHQTALVEFRSAAGDALSLGRSAIEKAFLMRKWSQRTTEIAEGHYKGEADAWKNFREAIECAWDQHLVSTGDMASAEEWTTAIEGIRPIEPFLVELFHNPADKDILRRPLGRANSLVLWPRRRIRARFQVFVTTEPQFGFSQPTDSVPCARMVSDSPFLTHVALLDALRLAQGLDYVVTLSTPNAGASVFGLHFQAMPRMLEFRDRKYDLFGWLDHSVPDGSDNAVTLLDHYPAVCVRVLGDESYVTEIMWHFAHRYNALTSYNLVIRPCPPRMVAAYFFPRPFSPMWEGPEAGLKERWAFGAFELGGFFLLDNAKASQFQAVLQGGATGVKH
jgi:hypothetical protein